MSGPKYGYPYNNPKNYIFPETPLEENTEPNYPLTKTTNREGTKDVYGNDATFTGKNTSFGTGAVPDRLALGSELEPSTFENPLSGGFYISGPIYCDTCNMSVSPEEMSLPRHLGHNTRNGDQQPIDIDQIHKTGGDYKIDWEQRNEPTNPSGMDSSEVTKPLVKAQPGVTEDMKDYAFTPKPNEEAYKTWRAKPKEAYDDTSIIHDEGARIGSNIPNEGTIMADEEDRTKPM